MYIFFWTKNMIIINIFLTSNICMTQIFHHVHLIFGTFVYCLDLFKCSSLSDKSGQTKCIVYWYLWWIFCWKIGRNLKNKVYRLSTGRYSDTCGLSARLEEILQVGLWFMVDLIIEVIAYLSWILSGEF